MIGAKLLKYAVVLVAFNINNAKCDRDNNNWCYEKCLANNVLRNTKSNVDIYFEYKKAVIKIPARPKIETNRVITLPNGEIIPGMLKYEPLRTKIFRKRQLRGIIAKTHEVTMREFQVTPVEETCNSSNFMKTRKKINCKPRPVVIDVVSTEGKVFPDKVFTKQCSGYCTGNRICSAVKTKNIPTSVQVGLENGKTQCSTIMVPQDTKCKCQCAITEKDCISNQKFNKTLCMCECTNQIEKNHCERKIRRSNKHFWDAKTCSCTCLNESPCTTGTYWDKAQCRCTKQDNNG